MNKIAVCQPYFAPYLGYFQLLSAVDVFVSYDDVNFIKGGWINRNKICVQGKEMLFQIPLKKQSPFKKINEIKIDWDSRSMRKLTKTLQSTYSKSKYKNEVLGILEDMFKKKPDLISELALDSIRSFCNYLDIEVDLKTSSYEDYKKTDDRVENLVNICEKENIKHYINPIGGQKLYDKDVFKSHGLTLSFLQGTPSLSIIDVCMNNSVEKIKENLRDFKLV